MDAAFGVLPPDTLRGMAGLDVLRAVADGRLPGAPIAGLIGFRLVEVASGRAVFEGTPGERGSASTAARKAGSVSIARSTARLRQASNVPITYSAASSS